VINRHGPWKSDFTGAPGVPPVTAREIACQIALAHAVIGFINASVLRAIRRLPSQASQEKIAKSLFLPLAIGDVSYLFEVIYGTGNVRWKFGDWPRINVIVGIGFFIPRCVGVISSLRSNVDPVAGFAGSLSLEDTSKLATAGWTAGIERSFLSCC
jgi:hypothetical protein